MNALIIDDSKTMRRLLSNVVQPLGYTVFEAPDGQEGLKQLTTIPECQLVLVDWNMPNMDGIDFIKAMRSDRRFDDIRVVMVTTETEPARMARALMAGADEFMMKPFTKDMLIDKLRLIGVQIIEA